MDSKGHQTIGLRPGFTPLGIWAFSIGTSIGWGSFIVTCNTYLQKSGTLGTAFGLLIGMAVILVVTWNLQYMIRTVPKAGGLYSFEKENGENDLGFIAFWFILMTYSAILWANITSVPLFARFFLGETFQIGPHYTIFGYEVWSGEALLSMCAVLVIGVLCANSSRLPNYIMIAAALIFAAGFTFCAVIALLRHDQAFSYSPSYIGESDAFSQIIRIAAISPWAFIGFENIAHFSEEYTFPVRKVRSILISSVLVTTMLYIFVSLLSVSAYPPEYSSWLAYIEDMGNLQGIKAVPAFYAAHYYLGQTGVSVLMLALFGVILTSLIGNMLALSRLIFAAGREGDAPQVFSKLNEKGIPNMAIILIVAVALLIPFLGRTAIGWIVDVTTLGATIIYGMISLAVYKHARNNGRQAEKCTGIAGIVLMVCFLLLLMIPGLLPFHAMETESYILFIAWALLGLAYFRYLINRSEKQEYGQHIIVWIILLVLVLFASMMWVSRATENAANESVQRIYEYHMSHPDTGEEMDRVSFLQQQAEQISSTNMLYTAVSLGLFLLCIIILLNNYRQTQRLGMRLDAAEEEARAAQQIAYARLNALAGDSLCVYIVIPETGRYREYSAASEFNTFALPKEGRDFFGTTREMSSRFVYPEDLDRFLSLFTREGVMSEIERSGIFAMSYRLIVDGKPTYVQLKAAIVEEREGPRLVVGINDIDPHVRQEEEYAKRLSQAQTKASIDALTGVKNRHAYLDAEEQLDRQIAEHCAPEFVISIMDVNDLKKINDNEGHQAGDEYLRTACRTICKIFKHSPVFRVGGDEFAVISQGDDYENIEQLRGRLNDYNTMAARTGGVVIACGMAKYDNDQCVAQVFERADQKMYGNKNFLKYGEEEKQLADQGRE